MEDILHVLLRGECSTRMTKSNIQWLVHKATRYHLINNDLACFDKRGVFNRMTKSKRQWLAHKETSYCLINNDLYYLDKDQVLQKVPLSIDI